MVSYGLMTVGNEGVRNFQKYTCGKINPHLSIISEGPECQVTAVQSMIISGFLRKGKITLKKHTKVTFDRATTASTFFSCRIPNSQQQVYTVAVVFVFPNK